MKTWCTETALVMLYAGTPTSDSVKGAWSGRYEWWALQTFSEGDRVDRMLNFFLMGWVFLFVIILINLLVVCAILYILNYNASPQSIL